MGAAFRIVPDPLTAGTLPISEGDADDTDTDNTSDGIIKIADIPAGDYDVTEVAAPLNCGIDDGSANTATVPAGGSSEPLVFTNTCADAISITQRGGVVSYNFVGRDHHVEATVTYGTEPIDYPEGVPVILRAGSSTVASGVTDANGKVTLTYTHPDQAQHDLTVCLYFIDDDACDSDVVSNTLVKRWVENFVTGGGHFKDGGGRGKGGKSTWSASGNVGVFEGVVVGNFQIRDHGNKNSCHFDTFQHLEFYGDEADSPTASHNTAEFTASGWCKNGDMPDITVIIMDNGEPGKGVDMIEVTGGLEFGGLIDGGNYQVHNVGPLVE